jgi:hypothetical protein
MKNSRSSSRTKPPSSTSPASRRAGHDNVVKIDPMSKPSYIRPFTMGTIVRMSRVLMGAAEIRAPCGARKSIALRCLRVFVDQPAEGRAPSDLVNGQIGDATSRHGRPLAQRTMRPMFVVVHGVLAEDGCQVPFAGDEHAVGAFPADGAHPAFSERVRPRRLRRVLMTVMPAAVNTVSKAAVNFASRSRSRNRQRVCSLVEVDQQVPRLLGRPTRRWGERSSR